MVYSFSDSRLSLKAAVSIWRMSFRFEESSRHWNAIHQPMYDRMMALFGRAKNVSAFIGSIAKR